MFVLVLSLFGTLNATESGNRRAIQGISITHAQSASAQAVKPAPSTRSRYDALFERVNAIKETSQQHSRSGKSGTSLTPISQSSAKVRFRPLTGTPMEIKGRWSERRAAQKQGRSGNRDEDTARSFLSAARDILRIDDPDHELRLCRSETDRMNQRHLRFSQTYQNLPVWPAELTVHLDPDGNVYMMNGAFVPTPRKTTTQPLLDADEAAQQACDEIGSMLGIQPSDLSAKTSNPERIIYAPGDKTPCLAWKTEINVSISSRWLIVIDALTGETLRAFNQVADAGVAGSGKDLFGVTRSLNVWQERGTYYMADTSKPMYDAASSDPPSPNATYGAVIVLDAGNQPATSDVEHIPPVRSVTSDRADDQWLPDAVSAAHSLGKTYDYYWERHGRNSIDDRGCSIFGVVRVGLEYANAFWNSETKMMYFGDAISYAGAIDVVAHELTHGVTSYTANLIYWGQSGAMNESFSDIFGEMVESHATGNAPDWAMGTLLSEPIRSLSDPSSVQIYPGLRYPSDMGGFIHTDEDNGGVHLNCTIVAHAFYLLAEGLEGAIGIQDAEKIFYRALAYHLVTNSQFVDARLACIASAEELFGQGAAQASKTAEAFDAVGIFDSGATPDQAPYIPPVTGDDAALFVYHDGWRGYYLGRREGDDPAGGVRLSSYAVTPSRPAVSGDGTYAMFVDALNDLCLIPTDGFSTEDCMGWYDTASVAMSPDESLYGFVFLDETGEPGNQIAVFDMDADPSKDTVQMFDLVAPTFSEQAFSISTIERADAMTFTADNKYIIYDALNLIRLEDGSEVRAWSLYAIDLETKQTLVLVPPVSGLNIAFPALSHTSDNFITFDAYDADTGYSTIYAMNLSTGDLEPIAMVEDWGTPCYTGDDTAIVFSSPNVSATTGFSLWRQPVSADQITPEASPTLFLGNGDYGTIYRRGTYGEGDDDAPDNDGNGEDETRTQADTDNDSGGGGCFITTVTKDFGYVP